MRQNSSNIQADKHIDLQPMLIESYSEVMHYSEILFAEFKHIVLYGFGLASINLY